jgi:hypothetical protein
MNAINGTVSFRLSRNLSATPPDLSDADGLYPRTCSFASLRQKPIGGRVHFLDCIDERLFSPPLLGGCP